MLDAIGWAVTVGAIVGVVLNNHRIRYCFVLWFFTNAATAGLHVNAGLWPLVARDVVFLVLAVHGWLKWSNA